MSNKKAVSCWDDEDSDSENDRRRSKIDAFDDEGPSSSSSPPSRSTAAAAASDEGDDDTLDSFMEGLGAQQKADDKKERAERFDLEGDGSDDDEATGWDEGDPDDEHNDNEQGSNSSDDERTSSKRSKKDQESKLLLPPVDHSKIDYAPFKRVFLDESASPTLVVSLPVVKSYLTENEISASDSRASYHSTGCDALLTALPSFVPILDVIDMSGVVDDTSSSFPSLASYKLLPQKVIDTLITANITTLTPIQSVTLPLLFSGGNLLATSPTGSGKTLCFTLPLLLHVLSPSVPPPSSPAALVLSPTRELAHQTFLYVRRYLSPLNLSVLPLYGGLATSEKSSSWAITKQLKAGDVQALVATPSRLLSLVAAKALSLRDVTYLVLDEGDRLATMEFRPQVESVVSSINPNAVIVIFSATFDGRGKDVARSWLSKFQSSTTRSWAVRVGEVGRSTEHVKQSVVVCGFDGVPDGSSQDKSHRRHSQSGRQSKFEWLLANLPKMSAGHRVIVFVKSRDSCTALRDALQSSSPLPSLGVSLCLLHGSLDQPSRSAALLSFKRAESAVLIATDVAGRGLDVRGVSCVVNYDRAKDLDGHSHRVGRAGRLEGAAYGRGECVTLLCGEGDRNFAAALKDAFRREGREVDRDFEDFAGSAVRSDGGGKKHGGGPSRGGHSGVGTGGGLGYYGPSKPSSSSSSSVSVMSQFQRASDGVAEESSKRSRWDR